jgi:hypothetical protein
MSVRDKNLVVLWVLFALHVVALVAILFAASPAAENNPAPTRVVSKTCDRGESPVCPAQRCAPAAAPFGALSASICNPAIAGFRPMSEPGFLIGYPAKQSGAPHTAPTLPAVAGLIFQPHVA